MTTQAVAASVGNPNMTRIFSATGTDGQYNNLNDSVTSTAIGLSMPGQIVSYVCATITAGVGLWRIISSQSNQIYRQGFTSPVTFVDPEACMIPALQVQPDMLFQIYCLPVDTTANQTNNVALVTSNRGVEAFQSKDSPVGGSELLAITSGLGVGDLLFGAQIQRICVQSESGAALTTLTCVDPSGGTQYTGYGNVRLPDAGGKSLMKNASYPLNIQVLKGTSFNIVTVSA
tara:strand:+ start:92 stop:784 length:693 start_codon:yes stop_codon:yes gene_type:complete